ncbi:VWA domain-containing protein [Granulicella sp. 5B5]|uniref:VWA domain-containing protein n=1 Tax=Granulicella sp. 5B5 TaxID=1617967 RepID=UPI0015F39D51|nr:VWA domain-containing protein [Granulicella sp. 5B5]QMV19503.1 VWA domain-containing protein [Granulicella sp. 5B5]
MVFGKGSSGGQRVGRVAAAGLAGVMGCVAMAAGWAQTPQQQVPNAPAPQALPQLNTLTPVSQLPDAPPAAPAADGQAAVPNALPVAQAPVEAPETHPDDGAPPDTSMKDLPILHVNVQFVQVPFTVKDSKGRLVPGLTWRDVRVYENGLRQQMRFFSSDPLPLSVALVIDQGVTQDTMEKINDSLTALRGAFSPYDEVSVFTYSSGDPTKQTDFTAAQSARLGVILDRSKASGRDALMPLGGPLASAGTINNRDIDPNFNRTSQNGIQLNPPKEYHTLNDAILAAGQETTKAGRDRRRIVYVISDGKEYGSKTSERQLIKYLQTNNIQVYSTLVGDSSVPGLGFLDRVHLPMTMRDDELPRICAATGGQTDPEFRLRGIENSFAKITEEVRTQYTVGYYTHESPFNESKRRIEIRVLRPGLTIISEDGYYPNARDSRPAPVTPSAAP